MIMSMLLRRLHICCMELKKMVSVVLIMLGIFSFVKAKRDIYMLSQPITH